MKIACIRTVFFDSPNSIKNTKWTRNKTYTLKLVNSKSVEALYLIGYIETDMIMDENHHGVNKGDKYYSPVSAKELKRYFTTIDEFRNRKIEHIINNKNNNDFDRY